MLFLLEPSLSPRIKEQHAFPDSRFNASYYLDKGNSTGRAEHAILNNREGSWCPVHNRENEWLELDLGSDQTIYGVAVQGSHDSTNKVTTYTISLRANGVPEGSWAFEIVSISASFWLYIVRVCLMRVCFLTNLFLNVLSCCVISFCYVMFYWGRITITNYNNDD